MVNFIKTLYEVVSRLFFKPKRRQITVSNALPFCTPIDDLEINEEEFRYNLEYKYYLEFFLKILESDMSLSKGEWNNILELIAIIQPFTGRKCQFCLVFPYHLGENYLNGDWKFRVCMICLKKVRNDLKVNECLDLACLYRNCENLVETDTFPFCKDHFELIEMYL